MFENYYDFYRYILSKFNPLLSADIKKLLECALSDYNDGKRDAFLVDMRQIARYLDDIQKTDEARTTRNWIVLLQKTD